MTSGRRLAISIGIAFIVVGILEMLMLPNLSGIGFLMALVGLVLAGGVALGNSWENRTQTKRVRR